jgi:hypothetical protein
MNKELKELLENKKSNGKTKKGCTSCKKKKPMTELPPLMDDFAVIDMPTPEEIRLAYLELGNKDINKVRPLINKVYNALFNEDFNFGCTSCVNQQANNLKIYISENLR